MFAPRGNVVLSGQSRMLTPPVSLENILIYSSVLFSMFVFYLQSGALSLVGRVEIVLSLVESFIEIKYMHDVATPALLCHKEPARRIQSP